MKQKEIDKHNSIFRAAMHRAAEAFFAIKQAEGVHYDLDAQLLSSFLTAAVGTVIADSMKLSLYGVTSTVTFQHNGAPQMVCGGLSTQTRETNIRMAMGSVVFWKVCDWNGEPGEEGKIEPSTYAIAGEDIEAGDPMELIHDRWYVHRDMKRAMLEKELENEKTSS